jgi:sugar phosphate permease
MRMVGVTEAGNSVAYVFIVFVAPSFIISVHVHGFLPYFFVPAASGFTESMCYAFRAALNQAALSSVKVCCCAAMRG